MNILSFKPRVVEQAESPLEGLAWHIASVNDEDFALLDERGKQWYRTMAEMVVSASKGRTHGQV